MSRRSITTLAVLAAIAVAPMASAQKVEITPHLGYRFGGGVTDYYTGANYDFNASEAYGLTVNYTLGLMGDTQLDFSWSRQDTDINVFEIGGFENFDVTVDYWQAGGLKQWHEDEPLRPFVMASVGAAVFSPGQSELNSDTRFAFTLGGGVKYLPGKNIGIRLQGKLYGTVAGGGAGIFCSGGCAFAFGGNVMMQMELSAGLIIAFGDS